MPKGLSNLVSCTAAALCAGAVLAAPAPAGQVTTAADGAGNGTLRHEIQMATPGEVITFDPGINPVLDGLLARITISQPITLAGNGAGATTITGAGDRIFNVQPATGTVTLTGLTLRGGRAPHATTPGDSGADGGAIEHVAGRLVIDGVEFFDNKAGDGAAGDPGAPGPGPIGTGGVGEDGGGGGKGGAIHSASMGELIVRNSNFHDNLAGEGATGGTGGSGTGGGTGGNGGVGGFGGAGGAIASQNHVEISSTTFTNNHAGNAGIGGSAGGGFPGAVGGVGGLGGLGGAVWVGTILTSTIRITGSTFNANTAGNAGQGGSGGIIGQLGGEGGSGGAITTAGSTAFELVNSTVTGNRAGTGGNGGDGGIDGGGGPGGSGGGVATNGSVRSSTIAGNAAGLGGTGESGAGANGRGGGFATGVASPVEASIIAGNTASGSAAAPDANCGTFGASPTGLFNLIFPGGTGCPGIVGDPLLQPLAGNGGLTQTMALAAGSPAIDQVPIGPSCQPTDQRGVARPIGPSCDIGAFEAPAAAAAPAKRRCKKGFRLKRVKTKKGKRRKRCVRKKRKRRR